MAVEVLVMAGFMGADAVKVPNCGGLDAAEKADDCRPMELNCWPVNCLRRRARRLENHT